MIDASIRIHCTRKPGTLSRIIREIKLFGLEYQNHKIKYEGNDCFISINASGELNCSREQLVDLFDNLPAVILVQQITLSRDGVEITEYKTTTSNAHINAREELSPAILLAAEKRMSEIIGPVSSFLVQNAAEESRNVGELYKKLAMELDDEQERKYFLSVVEVRPKG